MASRNNPFPSTNPMGRPEYWTKKRIDALIVKLKKYASKASTCDILEFRADNDLTYDNIRAICAKSPDFRQAYEISKAKIGARRQKKALTNKWHPGMVQRDDWAYTPETYQYNLMMKDKEIEASQNLATKALISEVAHLKAELAKALAE